MSRGLAVVVAALAVAGCGRQSEQPTAAPAATAAASATPAPTPCSVSGGSQAPRQTEPAASALVTDVRYSATGCPRVVFAFREQESGFKVSYESPPFSECGSGAEVSTGAWGASAYLVARLEPASSADLSKENAPQTYKGPRDIAVNRRVLRHLKVICDFEGVFSWLIGLDRRHDFKVSTLGTPSRIVIDMSEA